MARRQRGEGSVYQRGDGRWAGTLDLGYRAGKRRRKTIYGRTQAEVVRKLGKARRELAEHGDLPTAGTTLARWLDYWLVSIAPARVKPKTLATYRAYANRWIVPTIGRHRLDRLQPKHVREMHAAIEAERSSTTALQAHNILSRALRDAMVDGRVSRNVASLVERPTKARNSPQALSLPEAVAVMRSVHGDRNGSRWHMALLVGARQGECLGLEWDRVNLEDGVLDLAWQLQRIPYRHGCGEKGRDGWPCEREWADRCPARELDVRKGYEHRVLDGNLCLQRPKTKVSQRIVPMPPPLVASLRERRRQWEAERTAYSVDHGLVWPRPDGRPQDAGDDGRAWRAVLEACGIEPRQQHAARHTTATLLQAMGVPESVRMSIMGHSQAATQRQYAHIDVSLQREALDALGQRLAIEP